MSNTDRILLAVARLSTYGPVSLEALAVDCWHDCPESFCIQGYTEYPDLNKIAAMMAHRGGPVKRKLIDKVAPKRYALTSAGHARVLRLRGEESAPAPANWHRPRLTPEDEEWLRPTLAAPAMVKWMEGDKTGITFADACWFWRIPDHFRGPAIEVCIDNVVSRLMMLGRIAPVVLSDGLVVEPGDVACVLDLSEYLEQRYARHLTMRRTRTAAAV